VRFEKLLAAKVSPRIFIDKAMTQAASKTFFCGPLLGLERGVSFSQATMQAGWGTLRARSRSRIGLGPP
jgi:hypothetical protein